MRHKCYFNSKANIKLLYSLVMARLERDRPFINPLDSFSLKYVVQSLTSPHVILVFIAYFMSGTNLFGLALFLPSIVNQLGNSPNKSQLLSVGPFAAAFVREFFYLIVLIYN